MPDERPDVPPSDLTLKEALAQVESLKREIAERDAADAERAAALDKIRQSIAEHEQEVRGAEVRHRTAREQGELDSLRITGATSKWRDLRTAVKIPGHCWVLILDERAIQRIAAKVKSIAGEDDIVISVVSLDETEYRDSDPNFFLSHEMPRGIRSVIVRYKDRDDEVNCDVVLDASNRPSAPYVGGAGSAILRGRPAAVAIYLENPGQRTDSLPHIFSVDGVALAPGGIRSRPTPNEYDVTATVTTDSEPVNRQDLIAAIILRDHGGAVVGVDFARLSNVPDVLAPGARVRVNERVNTVAPATPGEVFAYADLR